MEKNKNFLIFGKSLYEDTKPITSTSVRNLSSSSASSSGGGGAGVELIKVRDLIGVQVESKKYMNATLVVKVLQIEHKVSKNGNAMSEVMIADQTASTILTLWSNQAKILSQFKVGAVFRISQFVLSNYPRNQEDPKHISWDLYKVSFIFN